MISPSLRDGGTRPMPESIAAIVPSYLWRFRKSGQFDPHTA